MTNFAVKISATASLAASALASSSYANTNRTNLYFKDITVTVAGIFGFVFGAFSYAFFVRFHMRFGAFSRQTLSM